MRVAMVNLTGGGLSGGYRKYLLEVLPLLREDPRLSELRVFVPAQAVSSLSGTGSIESWPTRDGLRGYPVLREELRRWRPDAVFVPTARWIDVSAPVVIMMQNMEPLLRPVSGNGPVEALRNLARRAKARHACARAARVVAVSRHVRDFLVDRWGVPSDRVGVVPHGTVPPSADDVCLPDPLRPLAERPFLFTAGSIRPARGLEDAIHALALVRTHGEPLVLVVGGAPTPGMERYERSLRRLAEREGVAESVIWAGQLDAPVMEWCYTHCVAFAMTSRVEACPNVVLEALAAGAVCVSTNTAPMPEFFDDAASYYTAGDAQGLASGLSEALALDGPERERRRARARARSLLYNWRVTARRTADELLHAGGVGAAP